MLDSSCISVLKVVTINLRSRERTRLFIFTEEVQVQSRTILVGSVAILTMCAMPSAALGVEPREQAALAIAQASEKVNRQQFEVAVSILETIWKKALNEGWLEDSFTKDEAELWENFLFLRSDYLWRYAFSLEPGDDRIAALERSARAHRDYFDFAEADYPSVEFLYKKITYRNRARSRLKNLAATFYQAGRPEVATSELEAKFLEHPEWFTPEGMWVWLYCLRWKQGTIDLASSRSIQERLQHDSPYRKRWTAFLGCFVEWKKNRVWRGSAESIEKEILQILGEHYSSLLG